MENSNKFLGAISVIAFFLLPPLCLSAADFKERAEAEGRSRLFNETFKFK